MWLALAGLGLSVLCLVAALRHLRRYGFLLGLIALVLLVHSLQAHKEYRFVFAVIPLWLLIGADLAARLAARGAERRLAYRTGNRGVRRRFDGGSPECSFPIRTECTEPGRKRRERWAFVRNQDPIFPAYRYLARAPGVAGIWQVDRPYYQSSWVLLPAPQHTLLR